MIRLVLLLLVFVARIASAASAPSTTHLWSPVYPTAVQQSAFPTTDTLRCNAWVPEQGIVNATAMGFQVTGGLGGGGLCSVTVYVDDGTSVVATTGATSCATSGPVIATGLTPFTLVEGTKYQVCVCANATGGSYLTGVPSGTALTDLQNVFLLEPGGSTAPNTCVSATPPASTGLMTSSTAVNPPRSFSTSTRAAPPPPSGRAL